MANVPRSSFIPKQVTQSAVPKKVRHTRVFSIFGFISGALLFFSLALSAGVFILKDMEERNLTSQREALAAERGKFNESDIAEIRAFDKRIQIAHALLDGHVSPSKVFEALENSTKQSVQYTSFVYVRRPSGDVSLDLFGVTDDFAKVALQSLQNSEDFILKDMSVTEIGINLFLNSEEGEAVAPVAGGDKLVNFKLVSNIPAEKLQFEVETTRDVDALQTTVVETATTTEVSAEEEVVPPVPSSNSAATSSAGSTGTGTSITQ